MAALKNAQQERYAQNLASGMQQGEAYAAAGYKANAAAACKLAKKDHMRARVAELQSVGAMRAEVTVERVLAGLLAEAERVEEGASHSARVSAWTALGKHLEMFTDKVKGDVDATLTVEVVRFGEDQASRE
jgi:phage terminase small subunit